MKKWLLRLKATVSQTLARSPRLEARVRRYWVTRFGLVSLPDAFSPLTPSGRIVYERLRVLMKKSEQKP